MMNGWLSPLGFTTWQELIAEYDAVEVTWFWTDQTGAQLGQLPKEEPLATHLWGWGVNSWYRLRLDQGRIMGARLSSEQGDGVKVQVRNLPARGRSDSENNMLNSEQFRNIAMEVRQVCGKHLLTFISMETS